MNDSHKQHPTSGQSLKAKSRKSWETKAWKPAERLLLESCQPLKMWKEQALARWEREVQTTSPTNDPLLAHDGKGRAHSEARD